MSSSPKAEALLALGTLLGCAPEKVVDFRPGCEVCHQPRPAEGGEPFGIEDAHPFGSKVECVDCHGGDPESYDQRTAHVQPGGSPRDLRGLSPKELERAAGYQRFVNPGAAPAGCSGFVFEGGSKSCHGDRVGQASLSPMWHAAGELLSARTRLGMKPSRPYPAAAAVGELDGGLLDLATDYYVPPPIGNDVVFALSSTRTATAAVQVVIEDALAKSCLRCHLADYGDESPGHYRSSGCTACHMPYAADGISRSDDPRIDKTEPPHPARHTLVRRAPTETCKTCHDAGGARIGLSFVGEREAQAFEPATVTIGANGRVTDEDNSNEFDETPPDVHFERGLACVDCHRGDELHGGPKAILDGRSAVQIRCESCHGTVDARASQVDAAGVRVEALERDEDGVLWLKPAFAEEKLRVTELVDALDPKSPAFDLAAAKAMGRDAKGFSHTDRVECAACHSAWAPSCYGCHFTVDLAQEGRVLADGTVRRGRVFESVLALVTDDLVLVEGPRGKVAASMPAERLFLSVQSGADTLVSRWRRPRSGQRAIHPHTIQKKAAFASCDRCHKTGDGPASAALKLAVGLGSDRFVVDGAPLDATVSLNGAPLVEGDRPLSAELRRKLLETKVEP